MLARRKLQKDTSDLLKRLLPASVIPSLIALYTQQTHLESAMKVIYSKSREVKEVRKFERLNSNSELSTNSAVVPLTAAALAAHRASQSQSHLPSLLSFAGSDGGGAPGAGDLRVPSAGNGAVGPTGGRLSFSVVSRVSSNGDAANVNAGVGMLPTHYKPPSLDFASIVPKGYALDKPRGSVSSEVSSIGAVEDSKPLLLQSDAGRSSPMVGQKPGGDQPVDPASTKHGRNSSAPLSAMGSSNSSVASGHLSPPLNARSAGSRRPLSQPDGGSDQSPAAAQHRRTGSAPTETGDAETNGDPTAGRPLPDGPPVMQPRRESQMSTLSQSSAAPVLSGRLPTIAHVYNSVTVLQADICDFTPLCSTLSATDIVWLLNDLFFLFDQLTDHHGVYKVETIGDAYLAVAGAPTPSRRHAQQCADLALDMQKAVAKFKPRTIPKMFQLDAESKRPVRKRRSPANPVRKKTQLSPRGAQLRGNASPRGPVPSAGLAMPSNLELTALNAPSTAAGAIQGSGSSSNLLTADTNTAAGAIHASVQPSSSSSSSLALIEPGAAAAPSKPPAVLRMRIGVHSGSVVGGVVGITNMPRYHLFGETVLCVEKLESHTPAGAVCVSEATAALLQPVPAHFIASIRTAQLHGPED